MNIDLSATLDTVNSSACYHVLLLFHASSVQALLTLGIAIATPFKNAQFLSALI